MEKLRSLVGVKVDLLVKETVENDDDFVQLAKPYITKIQAHAELINGIVFRGEANGQTWKGSGNKNNPTSKNQPNIRFYGVDVLDENGIARKVAEPIFDSLMNTFGLERCKVVFDQIFYSREEIEQACKTYFKTNLIEGIVVRNSDSTFSAKFMNDEYDSKK